MPLLNEARIATKGTLRRRVLKEKEGEIVKYTGQEKTAEPPPPKGVSVQEWDKLLQGGPAERRLGRLYARRGDVKTAAQDPDKNKDGYKLQGRDNFQGLPIAIENDKGSVRSGKNEDGSSWRTKFRTPYGYIEGTKGADGDEIDAYVGPDKKSTKAFVVHQKKGDGSHDEDTVMLGFSSAAAAKKDILRHYDDKKQIGAVTPMAVASLRAKVMPGKKVEKLGSYTGRGDVPYKSDEPHMTGAPARAQRKKGDVPTREDMPSAITVDSHQAGAGMKLGSALGDALLKLAESEKDHPAVAVGKVMSRRLDKANPNRPRYASLKDFILRRPDPRHKTAAMLDELSKIGELKDTIKQKIEEARHVDTGEATAALKRLNKLEKEKPSAGQIARGALVGSVVGPTASLAWRTAAGKRGRAGFPIWMGARAQAAHAAHGAVYGGVLPAGRQKLERESEKQKLREYVGQNRRGTLRGKIKSTVGV